MQTPMNTDAGTADLLVDISDGVLTLTMNRPEARNALSRPMLTAMQRLLHQAEFDPAVRCVVLTGSGNAFCAGGDVKGMAASYAKGSADITVDEAIHIQRHSQRETAGRLFKMPKPTLAVLPGAAAGAGLSLALACDLRIMSRQAFMTTAFAKVGFAGDYGGSYFLTQLIGSAKARELYLLSDRLAADEALRLGLTNWVAEPDALDTQARAIAQRLASGPPVAYRYMKENLNRAMGGDVDECLDMEVTHHVHCAQTEDHRNAALAFVEKRSPVFLGR